MPPKSTLTKFAYPVLQFTPSSFVIPTLPISPLTLPALKVEFVMGVVAKDGMPTKYGAGDIAFAGRSNVGKSSLLNALLNKQNLARVSSTPGRTQQLNFFNVGKLFRVVDMPGYGYAKKSPKAHADEWQKLIGTYIRDYRLVKRLFLLIDSRRGLNPVDIEFMQFLDGCEQPFQVFSPCQHFSM